MKYLVALALALGIVAPPAQAENAPKVWTNEDLERMFGPSEPGTARELPQSSAQEQWEAVEAFLDRQYRRIESEKERDVRREEIQAAYPPKEPRYALGWAPRVGTGWWWPGCGATGTSPANCWRPGPSPYRSPHAGVPYRPERPSRDIRNSTFSTGISRSAGQVNPVGGSVSRSARAVNPANAR